MVDSGPGAPPTTEARAVGPGSVLAVLAGRYDLTRIIGRGGMGDVWEAVDRRLGRTVAVKILRTDRQPEPAVRLRFEHEARLAARIVNPHVVAVFDAGEQDSVAYLVMERLSGRTLADEIAIGPLAVDQVREVGKQILDALRAAHDAGLVHRDVKPANVLVAGDGWWKVGDFGIAKTLEGSELDTTASGLVIGTPAYLAPERLRGEPATVATDVYATGMVLYEALTGTRPAPSGPRPLGFAIATADDLRVLRPDLPVALTAAIMRSLEPDPSRRFANAAEMGSALARSHADPGLAATVPIRPLVAADETQVMAATAVDTPVPPVLAATSQQVRSGRVLPLWLIVLAVLAVLAVVAGAVLGFANRDEGGGSGGVTTTTVMLTTTTIPTTVPTTAAPVAPAAPGPKGNENRGKGHGPKEK